MVPSSAIIATTGALQTFPVCNSSLLREFLVSIMDLISLIRKLSAMYMEACAPEHIHWTFLGAAIRLAQDVGAHTRQKYGLKPTVQGELWKRAFW